MISLFHHDLFPMISLFMSILWSLHWWSLAEAIYPCEADLTTNLASNLVSPGGPAHLPRPLMAAATNGASRCAKIFPLASRIWKSDLKIFLDTSMSSISETRYLISCFGFSECIWYALYTYVHVSIYTHVFFRRLHVDLERQMGGHPSTVGCPVDFWCRTFNADLNKHMGVS